MREKFTGTNTALTAVLMLWMVIFISLVYARLSGKIMWSWLWVSSVVWIPFAIVILCITASVAIVFYNMHAEAKAEARRSNRMRERHNRIMSRQKY